MTRTKIFLAMRFNEIKRHATTSLGLVGGCIPCILLCPRLHGRQIPQKPYFTCNILQIWYCIDEQQLQWLQHGGRRRSITRSYH